MCHLLFLRYSKYLLKGMNEGFFFLFLFLFLFLFSFLVSRGAEQEGNQEKSTLTYVSSTGFEEPIFLILLPVLGVQSFCSTSIFAT